MRTDGPHHEAQAATDASDWLGSIEKSVVITSDGSLAKMPVARLRSAAAAAAV